MATVNATDLITAATLTNLINDIKTEFNARNL